MKDADLLFKALADPSRRKLLDLLFDECAVSESYATAARLIA